MKEKIKQALGKRKVAVLAVAAALTVGTASTALAANGGSFILGVSNAATAVTKLTGNVDGASLKLINPNTGTAARALALEVASGKPPMTVNSSTKVANLNADQLDGQDSSTFLPANGKAADADKLDGLDSNQFMRPYSYRVESSLGPGSQLGDGTFKARVVCPSGDRLLSGGAANIDDTSVLLESFPGDYQDWMVRIKKNGVADDLFSAVALCADMP